MMTFDTILPILTEVLRVQGDALNSLGAIVVNRDLNGRVRLILDESLRDNYEVQAVIGRIAKTLAEKLGPHGYAADGMVLFEPSLDVIKQSAPQFPLDGFDSVCVIDRLATETDWADISEIAPGVPRIVFFSIKGGVGRSTALAAAAWSLAQAGKRVMVLDLDLESPGLSSSLLPEERRPTYGITDWLVEDLVNNNGAVFQDMVAMSELSHDGEIYVVPAHGRMPGEYIAKLGRAWMPKVAADGFRESWSKRLNRLIDSLEQEKHPDVILIDSRAGIDEVASACVTDLGAKSVLLFAVDGDQTWAGYEILFRFWQKSGVAGSIRDRLQLVGSMMPETDTTIYFSNLLEASWNLFTEELYDEIPPGESEEAYFNFNQDDESAPHFPWGIRWNRGYSALQSLHSRFKKIDQDEIKAVFGPLNEGVHAMIVDEGNMHV